MIDTHTITLPACPRNILIEVNTANGSYKSIIGQVKDISTHELTCANMAVNAHGRSICSGILIRY